MLVTALVWPAPVSADQVQYLYDDLGRLSQVIDEQGNVAIYTYDAGKKKWERKKWSGVFVE